MYSWQPYTPSRVVPKRRLDHQMPACGQHPDIPHGLTGRTNYDIALSWSLTECRGPSEGWRPLNGRYFGGWEIQVSLEGVTVFR